MFEFQFRGRSFILIENQMFTEVNYDLKNYLNEISIEHRLVLNQWARSFVSSLIIINETDSIVRNDLHDARGLLLERKDRGFLIGLILVLNIFHCLYHIFKINNLTPFDVTLD